MPDYFLIERANRTLRPITNNPYIQQPPPGARFGAFGTNRPPFDPRFGALGTNRLPPRRGMAPMEIIFHPIFVPPLIVREGRVKTLS